MLKKFLIKFSEIVPIKYFIPHYNKKTFEYSEELTDYMSNEVPASFIPGRILFVNLGSFQLKIKNKILAFLFGLKSIQQTETIIAYNIESISLLYNKSIQNSSNIMVGLNNIPEPLSGILNRLPQWLRLEILCLAGEFQKLKPEIVQAFTMGDSIKCGLAGLIAEVPKIILSCWVRSHFIRYISNLFCRKSMNYFATIKI